MKGFDKSLQAVREGIEKATKGLETSQLKLKEGVEKAVKTSEEILSFSQGNMEAIIKASQIYAAGLQDISKHFAASSKSSFEESVAFTKSLMGVKSVKEAVDLQTGFAKSSIEKAVSESNKLADATVKLTEQVDRAAHRPRRPGRRDLRQNPLNFCHIPWRASATELVSASFKNQFTIYF